MVGQGAKTAPSLMSAMAEPPLRDTGEHDQHPVAFVNPILQEDVCSLVGEVYKVEETAILLFAVRVYPDHRKLVAILPSPAVDYIEPEVKVFRDLDGECLLHLFVTAWNPARLCHIIKN